MEGKGTVTVGIDYYTDLAREHAIMQEQISALKRMLKADRYVSAKEIANIFGFNLDDPSGYQE